MNAAQVNIVPNIMYETISKNSKTLSLAIIVKTIPYKSISNRSGKENVILLLLLGNSIRMIPIAKITEAK